MTNYSSTESNDTPRIIQDKNNTTQRQQTAITCASCFRRRRKYFEKCASSIVNTFLWFQIHRVLTNLNLNLDKKKSCDYFTSILLNKQPLLNHQRSRQFSGVQYFSLTPPLGSIFFVTRPFYDDHNGHSNWPILSTMLF